MEGINIDIFPVDSAPDSRILLKLRSRVIDWINFIYQYRFFDKIPGASWKMKLFQTVISFIPPWEEMKFKRAYDGYIQ